jgi:predicted lipoprotein DUF2279
VKNFYRKIPELYIKYLRNILKYMSSRYKIILLLVLFSFHGLFTPISIGQVQENYPDTLNRKRLNTIIYTGTGIYTATIGVLYLGWYKGNELTSFHWHNDNNGWLQVDKIGHATTAYVISNYGYWSLRWAGVDNQKAAIYGGVMGWSALTVIEILDSFSAEWGASTGDLLANTAGVAFFTGQQLLWKEQRIRLKFSYHPTEYAQYRPDLLGESGLQRVLKDYNGQTYWLSTNIHSFLSSESKFPSWINVSLGYGGKGMLGASSNPSEWDGKPLPNYNRVRQYYLSLDIDWTRIKTNSSFLRFAFKTLSFVKIPFPTLEYNDENKLVFHPLFF